jgi:uncharacterized metal-binding protein
MDAKKWTLLPSCAKEAENLYIVLACDGASSVGQIGHEVAKKLTVEHDARMCCLAAVAANSPVHVNIAKTAKKLIVINGCANKCATKILDQKGIKYDYSITISEAGVKKASTLDFDEKDVDDIVNKVLKDLKEG